MTIREYHSPQFGVLRFAETKDGDYLPFVSDITRALEYSNDSVTLYNVNPRYWVKLEDGSIAITMQGFGQLITRSRKTMKRTLEYVVKHEALPLFKVHDIVEVNDGKSEESTPVYDAPKVVRVEIEKPNFAYLDDRDDINYIDVYSMLSISQMSDKTGIAKQYIINWLISHDMVVIDNGKLCPTVDALEKKLIGTIPNNAFTGRIALYYELREQIRKDYENGK